MHCSALPCGVLFLPSPGVCLSVALPICESAFSTIRAQISFESFVLLQMIAHTYHQLIICYHRWQTGTRTPDPSNSPDLLS